MPHPCSLDRVAAEAITITEWQDAPLAGEVRPARESALAWCRIIGPTACCLLMWCMAALDTAPSIQVPTSGLAHVFGVKPQILLRAFHRLVRYGMAEPVEGGWRIRRAIPASPGALVVKASR